MNVEIIAVLNITISIQYKDDIAFSVCILQVPLLASANEETCTEVTDFARASCRDDMEDGITAPRCQVKLECSKLECSYFNLYLVLKGLLFFFWANRISNINITFCFQKYLGENLNSLTFH